MENNFAYEQYNNSYKDSDSFLLENLDRILPIAENTANIFMNFINYQNDSASILELACGTGLLSCIFAKRGFNVTGIDYSDEALNTAKKLSLKLNVTPEWIKADMRNFNTNKKFDIILLWDVIFGIFPSNEENELVISSISRALNKNGSVLFEVYNKNSAIINGIEGLYFYNENTNCFEIKDKDNKKIQVKSVRLYEKHEWEAMLSNHNLELIKVESGILPKGNNSTETDYIFVKKSPNKISLDTLKS